MAGKTDYSKLHKRFQDHQKRQEEMDGDGRWWKPQIPQAGAPAVTHRVRILPPPDGFDAWYLEYGVHYQLKNDAGHFMTVTCPVKTVQKPCPVCEFTKGLWKSGAEEDKALARKIGSKTRYASNVILLAGKPDEVKLWSYGPKVWGPLNELCVGDSGEFVPIDDPVKGFNIKVVIATQNTAEGNFPNYTIMPEMKACPVPDKTVLERIHPMHELIKSKVKSYDEIRSILFGNEIKEEAPAAPSQAASEEISETPVADAEENTVVDNTTPTSTATVTKKEFTHAATPEGASQGASREELVRRAKAALSKRTAAQS